MTRSEPIIAVENVRKSSVWYQLLFMCKSSHGGDVFEILKDSDGTVILCLHRWGDHNHATLSNPKEGAGNGIILFFRVTDLNQVWENAQKLGASIERELHFNENSLKNQFTLRDPDNYFLIISE